MLKKATLISLLWIVFTVYITLSGCCGCGSVESERYCISINNTTLTAYNNADSLPVAVGNTDVAGKALLLRLKIQQNTVLCLRKHSFSLINNAYATSCRYDDTYVELDSVVQVVITANKEYDATHQAGSVLNDYFHQESSKDHDNDVVIKEYYALQSPEKAGVFTFTIQLLLADGNLIEAKSEPVNIIP
ncbi:MAG TPA: hypothetical protein VIN07_09170 [Flavipsychrobacter sp.]